ncbi:response regulator transcription factor [Nonomuraea sp. NPDC049725]|uniref:response regulator transcription factor n=1 Tax=Nonomuraea sp. NPDC049725 TaxID=3154508 RepID=UPI003417958A
MTGLPGPDRRPISVLLADDEPLLRKSLRIVIDSQPDLRVAGEAATGSEAVRAARELAPDVVLMDIRMPDGDGIHATRRITADPALAAVRVVVLTMFELDEYVYGALRAGAGGFLLKDAHPEALLDAVRRVHGGEALFAPSVLKKLVEHYVTAPAAGAAKPPASSLRDRLTPRETDVLVLIARGLSNDEIAASLHLSGNTIKTHISSLLAKLHARDRAQLVIAAYRSGLATVTAE